MKKIITAVSFLFILLPFTAHAGFFGKEEWEKEGCPKKHSLAWCLADYQGRSKGMRDMSQEDFVKALKKAGITDESQIGDILHSGLGVGTGLGMAAMGNLLGGSVFLLHALMPDEVEQNKRDPYVVFFDERTGRSKQQIMEDFDSIEFEAMRAALSPPPKDVLVTQVDRDIIDQEFLGKPINRHIKYFNLAVSNTNDAGNDKHHIGPGSDLFGMSDEIRSLPAYMGSVPVVSYRVGATRGISFDPPASVNRANLAIAISEKSPSWVYWFIPTGYVGNPFPLFLNQGKALFFVKHKEGEPTPVLPHVAARLEFEKKAVNEIAPLPASASGVIETSDITN